MSFVDPFGGQQVELSCKATVGDEEIFVRQVVARMVYDDPRARTLIERQIRRALMEKILEKWSPVIRVRQ